MHRITILIAFLFGVVAALPAWANASDSSDFRLEVVFVETDGNPQSVRHVTLEEVMALPSAEFQTTTIWTEGIQTFRGVWLSELLTYLSITEGTLDFSALNEYLVEIPLQDIVPGGPLVAFEWNGALMSPRDKGPLWVVFPYDSDAKFQTESVYAQSIWQLDRIEVYR